MHHYSQLDKHSLGSKDLEARADMYLKPWAVKHSEARRDWEIKGEDTHRTNFRRDRDRILYTKAFRRLQYKTQVMVNTASDHHRTRLTHTLEVQQLSTSIADALYSNRDLAEAIAVGHDIGHAPFGHAVEDLLDDKLKDHGGFSHAVQSVRHVEHLENHPNINSEFTPEKEGLNLCKQVREGVLKHDSDSLKLDFNTPGEKQWAACSQLKPSLPGSIEAQIVYWADKIAYLSHDWDDFIQSGLKDDAIKNGFIKQEEIDSIWEKLIKEYKPEQSFNLRDLIRNLCENLIENSFMMLTDKYHPLSSDHAVEITNKRMKSLLDKGYKKKKAFRDSLLVTFNSDYRNAFDDAQKFIADYYYSNTVVARMDEKAKYMVGLIYDKYIENPGLLSLKTKKTLENKKNRFSEHRIIADHIAGMTDRYANQIYADFFLPWRG